MVIIWPITITTLDLTIMILTDFLGSKASSLALSLLLLATLSFNLAAEQLVPGEPHIYGPTGKAESLKSIAVRVIGERELDLRETMADIYYANSHAFAAGRSQILLDGSLLRLPNYLAWNVHTEAAEAISEQYEPASHIIVKPVEETIATDTEKAVNPTSSPSMPADQSAQAMNIQLQLLKRQITATNNALAATQAQQAIDARLRGALYLVILLLLGLVAFLLIRARQAPASGIPVDSNVDRVHVETASTSPDDYHGSMQGEDTESPEDLTPVAPMFAYDDPTPVRPMLALDDSAGNPDSGDSHHDEPSGVSDINEILHDISGRFKDMSEDREASGLALARVYLDLGDYDQAKPILTELLTSSYPEYARQADEMFQEMQQSELFASSFHELIDDLPDNGDSTVTRQLDKLASDPAAYGSATQKAASLLEDLELGRELELAQAAFEENDYELCKQHLALILQSGNPDYEGLAYDMLKAIETALVIADENLSLKSSLRLDMIDSSTPA